MSMAKIKVISKCEIYDGMSITFKAPCDCSAIDGLNVYYNNTVQSFSFRDAHGNDLSGLSNLFAAGTYVKAVLNTAEGHAYLQNSDTNGYLESRFIGKAGITHVHDDRYYQKPESLSSLTKAKFSLGTGAVPDDVFGVLSRFQNGLGNEYVWERCDVTYSISERATGGFNFYATDTSQEFCYQNCTYGRGISLNEKTGVISLTGVFVPERTPVKDNTSYWYDLGEIYIKSSQGSVIKVNNVSGNSSTSSYLYFQSKRDITAIPESTPAGYVNSPDPNAYPVNDGYVYNLLGRIGGAAHIATGSYTGTGTTGKSSPNSLTFNFEPKFIMVAYGMDTLISGHESKQMDGLVLLPAVGGLSAHTVSGSSSVNPVGSIVSGNTVSWWAGNNVSVQMNVSGRTYTYTAIG